jgi:hypothetical protein
MTDLEKQAEEYAIRIGDTLPKTYLLTRSEIEVYLVDAFLAGAAARVEWVNVDERPAPRNTKILAALWDKDIDMGILDEGGPGKAMWFGGCYATLQSGDTAITHWQPLPPPPAQGGGCE